MTKIMRAIIGKEFGRPEWVIKIDSPFHHLDINFVFDQVDAPYPSKSFEYEEIKQFKEYLEEILLEHNQFQSKMAEINKD